MSFSGGLRLTDLNDYITPGQECIKPVEVKKTGSASGSQIKVDHTGDYYEVTKDGEETKLEAARITLNDCLACSGCVTSAETVLITMQSHHELLAVLEENRRLRGLGENDKAKHVVVTVAPQSRASLAVKHNISPLSVAKRMTAVLKEMGVDHVFDSAFTRDLTLVESAREFVERFRGSKGQMGDGLSLPVLSSWCPGWVCYAEKTHAEVLPWMSTTKSSQQTMGVVIKDYLAKKLGVLPSQIYHVAVMMCYDKKLEASRDDFYSDIYKTRDVDCVVTTGEFDRMLSEAGISLTSVPELRLDSLFKADTNRDCLYSSAGTSAGGGLEYVMSYAARVLFGIDISPEQIATCGRAESTHPLIDVKAVRNQSDHREISLLDPTTRKPCLQFAAVYGFRHLQNLVRKLKSGRAVYHYIEVAACPSACSNGGGQIQPEDPSPAAKKQWVADTERTYVTSGEYELPENNPALSELIYDWFGAEGLDSQMAKQALHTQFRGIVAKANSLGVSW
ncbi:Cytosolic Fe-S cluster assembly factor nar1 [Coemansia thaxteri]|uniref:Cytosolic Fe-S cluster assembly factor nar1 n=1 Tax=Coemansia thaxteri TaxID=2663907 RepID=A0A9W8BC42_9FUNG|nr:Cytosolic Fe-S cluster assembly factor nar1 [Coemansia thaxteri]KAJ2009588.1 Cytosolic Fe-S cluster assembly factor nar1 [Coemansia thaxteri]KAJ2472995.1 Cytosolic Fe-S cluster assembly factor nar1 [Coemansia sp. RSA 2322]KAJ2484383.1 Cytosolic Fe-S cluster assembly factor nar1 [Coemansia sp. RSA 2320]